MVPPTMDDGDRKNRIFNIELCTRDPRPNRDSLYLYEIKEVLERFMKLSPMDISGLAPVGYVPQVYEVRVKDLDTWQRKGIDNLFGIAFPLSTGKVVKTFKAFEEYTSIVVKGVPMSWYEERLQMIFSSYGDVKRIEENKWIKNTYIQGSETYEGIHNGSWRILLRLRKSIPSSLTIDKRRIEIHYRNQELSCFKCGNAHLRKDCTVTDREEFINRKSMKEFEEEYEKKEREYEEAISKAGGDMSLTDSQMKDTEEESEEQENESEDINVEESSIPLTKEDLSLLAVQEKAEKSIQEKKPEKKVIPEKSDINADKKGKDEDFDELLKEFLSQDMTDPKVQNAALKKATMERLSLEKERKKKRRKNFGK